MTILSVCLEQVSLFFPMKTSSKNPIKNPESLPHASQCLPGPKGPQRPLSLKATSEARTPKRLGNPRETILGMLEKPNNRYFSARPLGKALEESGPRAVAHGTGSRVPDSRLGPCGAPGHVWPRSCGPRAPNP